MRKLIGLALLPLASCATVPAQEPVAVGPGECRNEGLDRFTGQAATAELGAELLRVSGAKALQWIPQGTMVTMEFRADRLRVSLDANSRVERARCG
ncbi:MAG TPA: I78 family peptidase inhibitor [Sphingomicrobium sp.]|jgi:hypothetical protein|nr:I78 family peptidase inhibitor [Sphingomicrobium sp.]